MDFLGEPFKRYSILSPYVQSFDHLQLGRAHNISPAVRLLQAHKGLSVGLLSSAETVNNVGTLAFEAPPQEGQLLARSLPGVMDECAEKINPSKLFERFSGEGPKSAETDALLSSDDQVLGSR